MALHATQTQKKALQVFRRYARVALPVIDDRFRLLSYYDLLLKEVGFDPAPSSAPFVVTLVDITELVVYFPVGYYFPRGTLR